VPTPFSRSWWLAAVAGPNTEFLLFFSDDALVGGLAIEQRCRRCCVDRSGAALQPGRARGRGYGQCA
jgi:hypothetical protein